ncbi:hypothetical protein MGN70_001656 [Eutypa lata]|uniref:Uncharacterized protein n=1 Tax=Eutypa lata (strain UCR-EL1) TaxID=1287681 RepID=M7SP61_EUTLA|nr:hypothetical protein UCREL1_4792 [Eutypa lata UCREL1]KAI1256532.1 hypothetical protein MGN70_001656 [Eutypa lata]
MPSYYYGPEVRIRSTRPSKKYEFVRSKSFSYGHRDHHDRHHHHHHRVQVCPENCAGVTYDEWDAVLRDNRKISARYENTTRENQTLKNDLQNASAFTQQLSDENQQLRYSLSHDSGSDDKVDKFRRRVAAMKAEVEKKDHTIYHLEKENASLIARVQELARYDKVADKIADLTSEVAHWKKRAADTLDMAKRFESGYDRVLKDLEKKSALIDQYRDKVRHLEGHIPRSGSFRVVHS